MAAWARGHILPLTKERGGAECDARGADAPKEVERERERERESVHGVKFLISVALLRSVNSSQ